MSKKINLVNYKKEDFSNFSVFLIPKNKVNNLKRIKDTFSIKNELAEYIYDNKGPARINLDFDNQEFIGIFWALKNKSNKEKPLSIIFQKKRLLIFYPEELFFIFKKLQMVKIKEQSSFFVSIISQIINEYIDRLTKLSDRISHIHVSLKGKIEKKNLQNLTIINQEIIRLRFNISENNGAFSELETVFKTLKWFSIKSTLREKIRKLNLMRQRETNMANLLATNAQQLSDTYDRTINNNLNSIMRFLTVWSLIFAIPPIISGFYGMNIFLPLAKNPLAWLIILILTIILIIAFWVYLHNHNSA